MRNEGGYIDKSRALEEGSNKTILGTVAQFYIPYWNPYWIKLEYKVMLMGCKEATTS